MSINKHPEKADFIYKQTKETVVQDKAGVTIRSGIITCGCGQRRAVLLMYKCLYCGEWYCTPCAEQHFGETIIQYRNRKELKI